MSKKHAVKKSAGKGKHAAAKQGGKKHSAVSKKTADLARGVVTKATEQDNKGVAKKSTAIQNSTYPCHPKNPYRIGSGYATVLNILAAHPEGIHREKLVELYAHESGKDIEKGARFDVQVVAMSPKDSNTGPRHKSARDGYWVKRTNDNLQLVID